MCLFALKPLEKCTQKFTVDAVMHMIWTAFSCNQHRKKWIPRIFPMENRKNVVGNARLSVEVNLTSQTKWYLYQLLFAANRHSLEWIPSFLWHKFYLFSLFSVFKCHHHRRFPHVVTSFTFPHVYIRISFWFVRHRIATIDKHWNILYFYSHSVLSKA